MNAGSASEEAVRHCCFHSVKQHGFSADWQGVQEINQVRYLPGCGIIDI